MKQERYIQGLRLLQQQCFIEVILLLMVLARLMTRQIKAGLLPYNEVMALKYTIHIIALKDYTGKSGFVAITAPAACAAGAV